MQWCRLGPPALPCRASVGHDEGVAVERVRRPGDEASVRRIGDASHTLSRAQVVDLHVHEAARWQRRIRVVEVSDELAAGVSVFTWTRPSMPGGLECIDRHHDPTARLS